MCASIRFTWISVYFFFVQQYYIGMTERRPYSNHAIKYVLFIHAVEAFLILDQQQPTTTTTTEKKCKKSFSIWSFNSVLWRFLTLENYWINIQCVCLASTTDITDKWCNECKISPWQSSAICPSIRNKYFSSLQFKVFFDSGIIFTVALLPNPMTECLNIRVDVVSCTQFWFFSKLVSHFVCTIIIANLY